MVEAVTDIIIARSHEPEGLKTMVVWSIAAHIALLAVALLWGGPRADETPRIVMTVSLGGAPGPRTGGQTQIGGQPVQAPPPQEQPAKPVEAPPAPTPPAMTLPNPRSRPRPQPKPAQAPPDATAKTPNTGDVPREGSTRVDTRVRGQGFGLSSAGGSGAAVTLDVTDFCCNEYLDQMVIAIRRNWDQNQGLVGSTTMQFVIQRNGTIQAPQVEKSSGFIALDSAAMRALQLSRLPPLPTAFENPTLTVHLRFDFQR
jgi:TonB family protein